MFGKTRTGLAVFCFGFVPLAFAVVSPHMRRVDVEQKLAQIACNDQYKSNLATGWRLGIYDAQVSIQRIRGIAATSAGLTEAQLQEAADALAEKNFHAATAYGNCPDQSSWIASIPSPTPIFIDASGSARIPGSDLRGHCASAKLEFVNSKSGTPRMLPLPPLSLIKNSVAINTNYLGDGLLSVSCIPKSQPNLGMVGWALIPVHKGPDLEAPFSEFLNRDMSKGDLTAWMNWINRVRRQEKLKSLKTMQDEVVLKTLRPLLATESSYHDRNLNSVVRKKLKASGLTMLGENRVISHDIEEAAWLLWNSPAHRGMLLSPNANRITIQKKTMDHRMLTVLVFHKK